MLKLNFHRRKIFFPQRWFYFLFLTAIIFVLINLNLFFRDSKYINANTAYVSNTGLDTDELEILNVQSVPFGSYLEMEFYIRFRGIVEVALIDSKGKTLERKIITAEEGKNKYRFDVVTPLAHGPYFVSLAINDRRITRKVE